MIKLLTDSSSYIPLDVQVEHNITVLPLKVVVDDKEYQETAISNDSFYKAIRKSKKKSTSLPLSVEDAVTAFEKEVKQGNAVLAVLLSSKISDSYKNACIASKKVLVKNPKASITIIDSQASCMQEGFAVIAAAKKIKEGAWLEDVIRTAENTIKNTRLLLIPDGLKYMEYGDRIKKFQLIFAGSVQMTPIITYIDGEIRLHEVVHTKSRAVKKAIEVFKSDIYKYGIKSVNISHIDALDEAMEIAQQVRDISKVEEVIISDIGPVVGAHIGPGTVGIIYETNDSLPKAEGLKVNPFRN